MKSIVIGSGFGGIAAALRLRAKNHEVVLIEKQNDLGGRARVFKKNGFIFDGGPTVITAPYLINELFELFNKKAENYIKLTPLDTWYRFIFEDGTSFDYSGNDLIRLASSIELLHTATLIHDDVVDESLMRRGKESIQNKWDNAHGVLVGDFVYSKAFQLMASFDNPNIIRALANATNRISEGEVLQLSLKNKDKLTENQYFEIIDRKTAELFKVSSVTAGILASCSKDQLDSLSQFSTSLGIAFQIQDDILDYYGDEKFTGKKVGKDYEEGKFTLPIITALKNADPKIQKKLLSLFEKNEKNNFEEVLNLLETANKPINL